MKPHIADALRAEQARRSAIPDRDSLILHHGALRTPDGDVPLKRIGKGAFAEVYREVGGAGRVFAFTDDEVGDKEIAATVHDDLPHNPHVPAVEKFGHTRDKTVYVMPYYRAPLRKTDSPQGWRDYVVMRDCHKERESKVGKGDLGYPLNVATADCARERGLSPAVQEALDAFVSNAANYGYEYAMEFLSRNLATDDRGNLVLLDPVFDMELRRKQIKEQMRRREQRERMRRW